MSNLLVEGFGTYGLGGWTASSPDIRNAMLSGAWAEVPDVMNGSTTGLGIVNLPWGGDPGVPYYVRAPDIATGGGIVRTRRVLEASKADLIFACRFAVSMLPSAGNCYIVRFNNGSNATICALKLTTTGALEVLDASDAVLASTSPLIVAESPAYLEMRVTPATGVFQLYVNEVSVLNSTGLAFSNVGNVAQFVIATRGNTAIGTGLYACYTDIVVRDTSGARNNAITGDRRVATLMVNRDDPDHQGWTPFPLHRFGTGILASVGSPGASAALYCAATTATDFGADDFTVEGSFRFGAYPTGSNQAVFFSKWSESDNRRSYRLYKAGPSLNSGHLCFETSTNGMAGTVVLKFRWPWEPEIGRWYHVAVARASGMLSVYVDGVRLGVAVADADTYYAGTTVTSLVGQRNTSAAVTGTGLSGWADEFRISKGVARYNGNFAPPTGPFPRGAGSDPDWASVTWLSGFNSGLFDESSAARTLTAAVGTSDGTAPVQFTPNDGTAAYQVLNGKQPPLDYTFINAQLVPSTGLFTLSGMPTASETVTLGTKDGSTPAVYKWVSALVSAFDVLIGVDAAACIANLIAAVNAASGAGTTYGTGTTANFDANATLMPSGQLLARALTPGVIGNTVATTSTTVNGVWSGSTLGGGADIPPYSQFGVERPPIDTTIVDSITLVQRAWKTDGGPAKVQQALVGGLGAALLGADRSVTTSPTYYFDTFDTDPDTLGPVTVGSVISGKVRVNRTE